MQSLTCRISERGIEALYHFTTTINLSGIYELGRICPRAEFDALRNVANGGLYEDYLDAIDEKRLDGLLDYVNTSLSHPNIYLLRAYRDRNDLAHYNWCVIELDISLIERPGTLFSVTNAASTSAKEYGIQSGVEGFEHLFLDEVRNSQGVFKRGILPARYPTDVQAEVLIQSSISTELIKGIHFESAADLSACRSAFKILGVELPSGSLKVTPDLYQPSRR